MKLSWFQKEAPIRVGAIVDVGDSKIEVALVRSELSKSEPNVIWTYTESLPEVTALDQAGRLRQAVFNSFAAISRDGIKLLRSLGLSDHIELIQASLHAPYAFTISRSVTTKSTQPFKITRALVRDLEAKASADAYKVQSDALVRSGLKLYPLSSAPIALRLNGYETKYPYSSSAAEVSLHQHVSLASIDFVSILKEARDKYLPLTAIDADSFASLFSRTVAALSPEVSECSLIAIGDQATEFMIVRDGLPQSTTFMPLGIDHISAEISRATGLLSHEARGYTKDNSVDHGLLQSNEKKTAVDGAIALYEKELKSLLSKTGDALALPKPIFLQTECDHEQFFAAMVARVAGTVTGMKHVVQPITSEFFACRDTRDASLLSLAYVFHKKLYEDHYLDL